MKYYIAIISLLLMFLSCKKKEPINSNSLLNNQIKTSKVILKNGETISTRFLAPKGYKRIIPKENSFENYLQNFKLKPSNSKVHLYNGGLKNRQDIHEAVLDINVGKRDLQQCADATMRLRAEHLFMQKKYNAIHFNFTNGFNVAYSKWRKGYRLKVVGNNVSWFKTDEESTSYASFYQYMQWIFMYAGTLSLDKELQSVPIKDMKIGDIFIQGGSPGHAIIVVDMAKNSENEAVFIVAQSYMPAQEIHILKNLNSPKNSPWYSAKNLETLQSPEWAFTKHNLKRFSTE